MAENILAVELAGAGKNVYAIAAGISDGLGFENNTRAGMWSMLTFMVVPSSRATRPYHYRTDNQISR